MRRTLLAAAALALPFTGVAVGLSTPAFAKAKVTVTCTAVTGTVSGTITISGCSGGSPANSTGGSSQPLTASTLAAGGTVTWISGSSTTIAKPKLKAYSGCGAGSVGESFKAKVKKDVGDGIKGGTASGTICYVTSSGVISAAKPLVIN